MSIEQRTPHYGIDAGSVGWSKGKGSSGRAGWSRSAALGAALAVTLLMIGCASAVKQPQPTVTVSSEFSAAPGSHTRLGIRDIFDDAGSNPRFTSVALSTMEYYQSDRTGIVGTPPVELHVQVKTSAELNALSAPPPSPFTVTATVTMTDDAGRTATGTITFKTTYDHVRDEPEEVAPSLAPTQAVPAPVDVQVSASADEVFDNAGTNPTFTGASFSTTEYTNMHEIRDGRLWVQVKSAAELNALPLPPPSPFTVTAMVTMNNDEGRPATGTVAFETTYSRSAAAPPTPPRRSAPIFAWEERIATRPGVPFAASADGTFLYAGTEARFTNVVFSTTEYSNTHEISDRLLRFEIKTAAQLNALQSPPSSPFTVTATVTMTNDEGQTASGTLTFRTSYDQDGVEEVPTLSRTEAMTTRAPDFVSIGVYDVFDNAGTNAKFTSVKFSTLDYYHEKYSVIASNGNLWVQVKTTAQLNALSPPPPSPFTVTATVTMSNAEGQTATGTLSFVTRYNRSATTTPIPPRRIAPIFAWEERIATRPGVPFAASADGTFLYAGTEARFTNVVFSTTAYSNTHEISEGLLRFEIKSAAQLNALQSPPSSPFTVTATVTMTNDEGQTASGKLTFRTSYDQDGVEEVPTLAPVEERTLSAPDFVSISVYDVFDNAGTNAKFTNVKFSTLDYYHEKYSVIASNGKLWVQVKTAAQLRALPTPPPSPFTVTAKLTMTNGADQTATGTITFTTTYNRTTTS